MTECVNFTLRNGKFSLKDANITPIHKKDDPTDKVNYRPVSILPSLSKIFERVIYNQLGEYMDLFLNKLLCEFRKAHSAQHALFKLFHSFHKRINSLITLVSTILMDLSKAYDCLPYDFITAKFEAYGLSKNSLKLLLDYIEGRKQRMK